MAGKFTQLALLTAGLFLSYKTLAASDDGSTCVENANIGVTASVRFIGASSCSAVSSIFTGNDHCEVKAASGATCEPDQFGVLVGEPYIFTGCLSGQTCDGSGSDPDPTDPDPIDPDPDPTDPDPTDPDPADPEPTDPTDGPFEPTPSSPVNSSVDAQIASGISSNFSKILIDLNDVRNGIYINSHRSNLTYNYVYDIKNEQENQRNMISTLPGHLGAVIGNYSLNILSNLDATKAIAQATQAQSSQSANQILAAVNLIQDEQILDNVNQTFGRVNQAREDISNLTNLVIPISSKVTSVSNDISGSMSTITARLNEIVESLDRDGGGTGGDTGGGSSQDFADMLSTLESIDYSLFENQAAQTAALQQVNLNLQRLNDYAEYNTVDFNDYWSESNENFGQLFERLLDLKTAIETSSAGGSEFDDTQMNEKLDAIITNTNSINTAVSSTALTTQTAVTDSGQQITDAVNAVNENISTLSPKLDGIQTAIENIDVSLDSTEMNERLDTVISNTALINDNVVTNGMNNEHATQLAAQQITDAVNSLGEGLENLEVSADFMQPGTGQKSGPEKCSGEGCWKQASWIDSEYPEGIEGIWEEQKIAFGGGAMQGYLNSFVPELQGGAINPFSLCFDMGFVNFGCHGFSIPDYVIAFIRLCVLISAGFYCQRLVFGGA